MGDPHCWVCIRLSVVLRPFSLDIQRRRKGNQVSHGSEFHKHIYLYFKHFSCNWKQILMLKCCNFLGDLWKNICPMNSGLAYVLLRLWFVIGLFSLLLVMYSFVWDWISPCIFTKTMASNITKEGTVNISSFWKCFDKRGPKGELSILLVELFWKIKRYVEFL